MGGNIFNTSSRQKVNALPIQKSVYNLIRKIEMAQIDKWVKVFLVLFVSFLAVLQHEGILVPLPRMEPCPLQSGNERSL